MFRYFTNKLPTRPNNLFTFSFALISSYSLSKLYFSNYSSKNFSLNFNSDLNLNINLANGESLKNDTKISFNSSSTNHSHRNNNYIVFAGSGHQELASKVAEELGVKLGSLICGKFPDGETRIQILDSVRGQNIYIIQPTCSPINDNLIELMLLVSTFRRASAAKVTAVMPYFGYARQDRIRTERETIAASDVARMLETAGVDSIITLDLHRAQTEGFFTSQTQLTNLDSLFVGTQYFLDKDLQNPVIVCPSITGVRRAKQFRDLLRSEGIYASLAFIAPSNNSGIMDPDIGHHHKIMKSIDDDILVGNVKHSDVVIVDDMIDTGSRMSNAAHLLKRKGAKRVFAYATHGLLSGDCKQLLDKSPLNEVVVTDSIPQSKNIDSISTQSHSSDSNTSLTSIKNHLNSFSKTKNVENVVEKQKTRIVRLSIAPLIAESIRRTQINQSLTILTHSK